MDAPRYDFAQDWFTDRIPQFERFLQHLKGTPCRLLEVGSHEGRATTWLVENVATHPSAVIDTIDLQEHPTFRANIAATGSAQKVHLHLGSSARMLRALPQDRTSAPPLSGMGPNKAAVADYLSKAALAASQPAFPLFHTIKMAASSAQAVCRGLAAHL
jgi:hypothetical protein